MARKRLAAEQIVTKLRQIEVLQGQGNLPRIIGEWCEPFCVLESKRILDFGCGEGTTALGMALMQAPALVDIVPTV